MTADLASASPRTSPAPRRTARRTARRARRADWIAVVSTFVVVVGGWEAVVRIADISSIVLPPPSLIVGKLYDGLVHGTFVKNLGYTMAETVLGFAIAAFLGIVLGALVAEIRWIRRAVYPYIVAFQTVPKIALAPLLVIWFGFGMTSKVIVAVTVAFFPVIVNTIEGLQNTDHQRIDMIRAMGAGRFEAFRRVKLPSALPYIFAGLDAAIVLSLLGAVVGEFMGSRAGLGNQILIFNSVLDIAGSFAVLILLSIIGFLLHLLLVMVQKKVVFWTNVHAVSSGA
ncbi:ABC transporter permease [Aeromicrobium camelliae]|uniref:ABC transporter permease n=1 Tax=Aeromicrobium camelliae TaxID=1538144 RepID=A0A3N6W4L5_9ACTN|nr:ABC transporter permease [Aeromicrobium camelliae]RQN02420.1 ABC transporter permease [Aeromicrobium camelliae]